MWFVLADAAFSAPAEGVWLRSESRSRGGGQFPLLQTRLGGIEPSSAEFPFPLTSFGKSHRGKRASGEPLERTARRVGSQRQRRFLPRPAQAAFSTYSFTFSACAFHPLSFIRNARSRRCPGTRSKPDS